MIYIFRPKIILSSFLTAIVFAVPEFIYAQTVSRSCPYNCKIAGHPSDKCRDWREGDQCFVQLVSSKSSNRMVLCLREGSNTIRARRSCRAGEVRADLTNFIGETGEKGDKGDKGDTGESGELRIYGDGSAGSKTYSLNTTFDELNPQFTDFIVQAGVTLTVPSGTIIRCSGSFSNQGTIVVSPALREAPRFSENGMNATDANSGGDQAEGGVGGTALPAGVSKGLLRVGLLAGGNGYRDTNDTGSDGGGNLTVLCKGGIVNSGSITANGSSAAIVYRGGGGGGFIILASAQSIENIGSIVANGGDGGALLSTDANNTGHGPGGGGGGGIIHLIAPVVSSSGTLQVDGGSGGAAGGVNSITGLVYLGGGGGGGSGGNGGDGGIVNPGNINNNSTTAGSNGAIGRIIQTEANPAALF